MAAKHLFSDVIEQAIMSDGLAMKIVHFTSQYVFGIFLHHKRQTNQANYYL